MTSRSIYLTFFIAIGVLCSVSCFITNNNVGIKKNLIFRTGMLVSPLHAKKRKKKKGFAKSSSPPLTKTVSEGTETDSPPEINYTPLESIEESIKPSKRSSVNIDPSLSPEERNKQILKQRFGLTSQEERQAEQKADRQKMRVQKLVKEAKENADFDLIDALPTPLLVGIDRFLKFGLGISIILFIAGGIAITIEAWSQSTGSDLPQDIDKFITDIVEPNFTPGLGVLLGFSISLGVFSIAQLGSKGSQYRE